MNIQMSAQVAMQMSAHMNSHEIECIDLGLIGYNEWLAQQEKWVEAISSDSISEKLVVCTHLPVVTVGRDFRPSDVWGWNGEVVHVNRGGRATYHGPHQLMVYPLLNLKKRKCDPRFASAGATTSIDVKGYLRFLQSSLIQTLWEIWDIQASMQPLESPSDLNVTGVWVGSHKIASIGIGFKRWITFHGMSINIEEDPLAFHGIHPCGFPAATMTSLQRIKGPSILNGGRELLKDRLSLCFATNNGPHLNDPMGGHTQKGEGQPQRTKSKEVGHHV